MPEVPSATGSDDSDDSGSNGGASGDHTATTVGSGDVVERELLTAPRDPTVVSAARGDECSTLLDDGWQGTCEVVSTDQGDAAFIVEERRLANDTFEKRILVYVHVGARWHLALRASDDTGEEWTSFNLHIDDLEGDDRPEGVFSIRSGVPEDLAVVVVDVSGEVVVQQDLDRGKARPASEGGIETWSADSNSTFRHEVIRPTRAGWRIIASERVPQQEVPELLRTDPRAY